MEEDNLQEMNNTKKKRKRENAELLNNLINKIMNVTTDIDRIYACLEHRKRLKRIENKNNNDINYTNIYKVGYFKLPGGGAGYNILKLIFEFLDIISILNCDDLLFNLRKINFNIKYIRKIKVEIFNKKLENHFINLKNDFIKKNMNYDEKNLGFNNYYIKKYFCNIKNDKIYKYIDYIKMFMIYHTLKGNNITEFQIIKRIQRDGFHLTYKISLPSQSILMNDIDMLKYLYKKGYSLDIGDSLDNTLLMTSIRNNKLNEITDYLFKKNVSLSQYNIFGFNIVHVAVIYNTSKLKQLLENKNMTIDIVNNSKMYNLSNKKITNFKHLLNIHNWERYSEKTPLDIAYENNDIDSINLLENYGAVRSLKKALDYDDIKSLKYWLDKLTDKELADYKIGYLCRDYVVEALTQNPLKLNLLEYTISIISNNDEIFNLLSERNIKIQNINFLLKKNFKFNPITIKYFIENLNFNKKDYFLKELKSIKHCNNIFGDGFLYTHDIMNIYRSLQEKGALLDIEKNLNPAFRAVYNEDINKLKDLLKSSTNINTKNQKNYLSTILKSGQSKYNLLHFAIRFNDEKLNIIKMLLKYKSLRVPFYYTNHEGYISLLNITKIRNSRHKFKKNLNRNNSLTTKIKTLLSHKKYT
jgi:hypothetical protein